MIDSANPQDPKFIEELQRASRELEIDLQRKRSISPPKPPLERNFDQGLIMKIEEIAKEKRELEEIQKNLEKKQKIVQQRIQELDNLQQKIYRIVEDRKKIDEELQGWEEKNEKIFEDLKKLGSL